MAVKSGLPIIEGVELSTSASIIYTVPANLARAKIDNIAFTNHSASIVQVTAYIIEKGGSVANSNVVISAEDIEAGGTLEPSSLLQGMNEGDTLRAFASAATSVGVRATATTYSI